jgi:hypothetical protein
MVFLIALSWLYTWIRVLGKGWRPAYLLLPFYSFIQTMIIIPVAFGRYIKLAISQRSLGVLRYDLSRNSFMARVLFRSLNIGSASFVVAVAYLFTNARVHYWIQSGWLFR